MIWFFRRMRVRISMFQLKLRLNRIIHMQREIMADLTALNAAVAANTQAVADVKAAFDALAAKDQPAIDAAAAAITANNDALKAIVPAPAPAG